MGKRGRKPHLERYIEDKIENIPGVELHVDGETFIPHKTSQAERVIAKFGGVQRLHKILNELGCYRHVASIYRWTHPVEKGGTGGIVPSRMWRYIYMAARYDGVIITSEDIDHRKEPPLAEVPRFAPYRRRKDKDEKK